MKLLGLVFLVSLSISCEKSAHDVDIKPSAGASNSTDLLTRNNLTKFRDVLKANEGISDLILTEEARQLSMANPLKRIETDSLATVLLQPLLKESISFLEAEGINKNELSSIFGSLDDPTIIIGATVVYARLEEELQDLKTAQGISALRKPHRTELTGEEAVDCASKALVGVAASTLFIPNNMGEATVKRLGLTAVKSLAKKLGLGPVGTAVTVAIFVNYILSKSSDRATPSTEPPTSSEAEIGETGSPLQGNGVATNIPPHSKSIGL